MRIPIWPGVRLSLFVPQDQQAVRIRLATHYNPLRVLRLASMRGWFVVLVRYDWRDHGKYEALDRSDLPLTADEAWEEVSRISADLYQAQDSIAFVSEMCDIADRKGATVTTAAVREWLYGPQCARQAGLVLDDGEA
jgi:hypothetical protein